jgi:hypothetical protein
MTTGCSPSRSKTPISSSTRARRGWRLRCGRICGAGAGDRGGAWAGRPGRPDGRAAGPTPALESAASLRQVGDMWEIRYGGRTAYVRDVKGLHDLAALLAQPGVELAASGSSRSCVARPGRKDRPDAWCYDSRARSQGRLRADPRRNPPYRRGDARPRETPRHVGSHRQHVPLRPVTALSWQRLLSPSPQTSPLAPGEGVARG